MVTPEVRTPEVSREVREKLDDIVRAEDAVEDMDAIRETSLKRWKTKRKECRIEKRWGARRIQRDVEVTSVLCFSSLRKRKRDDDGMVHKSARQRRLFDIDVALYERPAFWGTGPFPNRPANASVVTGRRPFGQEKDVDYEYDSAEEWEGADQGESLSDEDIDEEDDMPQASDDEDDGFIAGDDEMADEPRHFDAAAIGDDAEMTQKRSTMAMLANRSRRSAAPLVISKLATTVAEDGGDSTLLRLFALEAPFSNAPRISLEVSTSQPASAVQSAEDGFESGQDCHKEECGRHSSGKSPNAGHLPFAKPVVASEPGESQVPRRSLSLNRRFESRGGETKDRGNRDACVESLDHYGEGYARRRRE